MVRVCPRCKKTIFRWKCHNCSHVTTRLIGEPKECPKCHASWNVSTCENCGYTESKGLARPTPIWFCPQCGKEIHALICPKCKKESNKFEAKCDYCGAVGDYVVCDCGHRHDFRPTVAGHARTCPKCGSTLSATANFCPKCGLSLGWVTRFYG